MPHIAQSWPACPSVLFPEGQGEQELALTDPASDEYPAAQSGQLLAPPDSAYFPAGQSAQVIEPAELEYLPAGQGVYVDAPAKTKVPALFTGCG